MPHRRLLVVLAAVLAAPSAALAHRLLITATAGPTEVVVETRYDNGDLGEEGTKVALVDAAGQVVAEGKADDNGVCRLSRPRPGTYTLSANDGAGHKESIPFTVPADEVTSATGSSERN